MKKNIILITVLSFVGLSLSAQSFQEGVFLDGYSLGFRDNPALSNEGTVLGLAQWNSWAQGNYGAANFLFLRNGEVVTGFHESVSSEEFLGALKPDNFKNGAIDFNIFSYAWRKGEAYHSIGASVRAHYSYSMPQEFFAFLKDGNAQEGVDLNGFSAKGKAYLDLSYGYSRPINDWLSLGARVKLLVGLAGANADVTKMSLVLSGEQYKMDMEADVDLPSRKGRMRQNEDGSLSLLSLNRKQRWNGPQGGGLAVDLGALMKPADGLSISVSALNLGGLLWYYGNAGKAQGSITFEGFEDLSYEEIQEGKILDQFKDELEEAGENAKYWPADKRFRLEAVPLTLNAGARYELPFYRPLSVGLTGSFMGWSNMSYAETRLALAWNHSANLGILADVGVGSYGLVWGTALTLGFRNFHLHAALQNGFGGTIPYTSTQLKANDKTLSIGLSYNLGTGAKK